jgi:hypothetical protein
VLLNRITAIVEQYPDSPYANQRQRHFIVSFLYACVPRHTVPMHEKLPAHRLVIPAGKVNTILTGYGGNGGSTVNRKLGQYYHSTLGGKLMVVDTKTRKGLQQIPTSNGARARGESRQQSRLCGHHSETVGLPWLHRGVCPGVRIWSGPPDGFLSG